MFKKVYENTRKFLGILWRKAIIDCFTGWLYSGL